MSICRKHCLLGCVLLLAVVAESRAKDKPASQPVPQKVNIKISRETTYLTNPPMNPDGTVNYIKYLQDHFSKGVTKENNAAYLILKAFGPEFVVKGAEAEVYKQLDMKPLPKAGDYLVTLHEYEKAQKLSKSESDKLWDFLIKAQKQLWQAKDCPEMVNLLKLNQKPLEVIIEASKRERFYYPIVCAKPGTGSYLYLAKLPTMNTFRYVAKLLICRANLEMANKNFEGAWRDLLAIRNLGRLLFEDSPFLIQNLVGMALYNLSVIGMEPMITQCALSSGQSSQILADLRKLPLKGDIVGAIDLSERYHMLDLVMCTARSVLPGKPDGILEELDLRLPPEVKRNVNWNIVLEELNSWHDRNMVILRIKDCHKRNDEGAVFDEKLKAVISAKEFAFPHFLIELSKQPSDKNSKKFGTLLASILMPSLYKAPSLQAKCWQRMDLLLLAAALRVYRDDRGSYPNELQALVPKYLAAIPADRFTGKPLVYRKQGKGYLLYGLGWNLKDDGGKKGENMEDGDIVVEVK